MNAVATVRGAGRTIDLAGRATPLLAPISFELSPATLVALAGPSGSGKTTLCALLMGWDEPDEGSVELHVDGSGWARRSVAPQRLALIESLSCGDNVRLAAWASASGAEPSVDTLASMLDITHVFGRLPQEVSLGEQQRVAVARALVGAPGLVVLDEPTCHQDEGHVAPLLDALPLAVASGSCVVVATHDPDLMAVADRVITLAPPG
jgi:ABC-type lipoprotein export system ATPase subunit